MAHKKKTSKRANGNKEETIKKRQDACKELFLEKLQESVFVSVAAIQAGVDRTTIYRWKKEDSKFSGELEKMQYRGIDKANDVIESILLKKAKEGDNKSIFFWLKHNHQRYTHRVIIQQDDMELSDKTIKEIEKKLEMWKIKDGKKPGEFTPKDRRTKEK